MYPTLILGPSLSNFEIQGPGVGVREPHGQDRMLIPVKSNLAKLRKMGLPFTISSARGSSRVSWGSREVEVDSDVYGSKAPTKLDEARKWLRTRLEDGPMRSKELAKEAENDDISKSTLKRAKETVCKSWKTSKGHWMVKLA